MTINGLHSCKPGHEPEVGQVKTFTVIHNPPKGEKKAWTKIKSAGPDYGGQPYRIVSAEPTGFTDSYGNISFNLEIESTDTDSGGLRDSSGAKNVTGAKRDTSTYDAEEQQASAYEKVKTAMIGDPRQASGDEIRAQHARNSRAVFHAAWLEAGEEMKTLMPDKDANELSHAEWYDLKLRIAQFIAIQTQRNL